MAMPNFKWDKDKAQRNLQKHGVSFEEAATVFRDVFSLTVFDEVHSTEEDRFMDIGKSFKGNILVVIYTERGSAIRIICCKKATRIERETYENQNPRT
jgi:uncharacterized DUF497 family protein